MRVVITKLIESINSSKIILNTLQLHYTALADSKIADIPDNKNLIINGYQYIKLSYGLTYYKCIKCNNNVYSKNNIYCIILNSYFAENYISSCNYYICKKCTQNIAIKIILKYWKQYIIKKERKITNLVILQKTGLTLSY